MEVAPMVRVAINKVSASTRVTVRQTAGVNPAGRTAAAQFAVSAVSVKCALMKGSAKTLAPAYQAVSVSPVDRTAAAEAAGNVRRESVAPMMDNAS